MASARLLCVLTTLLGNKSTTQRIIDALNKVPNLDTKYVTLAPDDYARYPAPRWARVTNPWHVQYIARKKLQPFVNEQFDLLFVYSWEFVCAFRDLACRMPAAALMDSVPSTIDYQLRERGLGGWKRSLSHQLHHGSFRRAAQHFRLFLPMGSDCADALTQDYGVPLERRFITLAPQDLSTWKPAGRIYAPPMQLLFVANDFSRKGGDFLLRLYSGHLSHTCKLTIASNDASIESRILPAGVTWLRGRTRDELLKVYQQSHLFLFPTQQDYMPQVLAEALATGLPCMANDVGGIRDLVRDGETGFLMSLAAPPGKWADKILSLAENPATLRRLSANARTLAEEGLDLTGFEDLIRAVIDRLGSG
ncbi:MAG: glycosyltransferase family 4 protein [Bryobacterales bacterium]|nr:glycosyltransferase family 4 protein [Bryobacterales bacterium]MBV9400332.1 glycosyltransferase family 4 protein [Bryobacterales bacterium]